MSSNGLNMQTRFIGIKTAQSRNSFLLWEDFLRDKLFARIIEIGTYKWGMSLFFFLWCKTRKAEFFTFDVKFFPATRVVRLLGVIKCFCKADVFSIEQEIGDLIKSDGMTILFCDGGNKPKELATFSKYLKKGDYICTHDWGTEVVKTDIPDGLTLIAEDEMTAIFQYA